MAEQLGCGQSRSSDQPLHLIHVIYNWLWGSERCATDTEIVGSCLYCFTK